MLRSMSMGPQNYYVWVVLAGLVLAGTTYGILAAHNWMKTVPFADDPEFYFENLHPVRYVILWWLQWVGVVIAGLGGLLWGLVRFNRRF